MGRRRGLSPMGEFRRLRGSLYRIARIMGDIQAVATGRILRRILRRWTGHLSSKGFRKIFK